LREFEQADAAIGADDGEPPAREFDVGLPLFST